MPISEQPITHGPSCFKIIASTDPHIHDEDMDPMMLAVLNRCWETGGVVIGNRHDDGSCTMEDVD